MKNRISWNEYFMYIAILGSLRSKDPNTQVGAVLVSEDNKILSIGYNGPPRDFDDSQVPWSRDQKLPYIEQKYPYICHSELNAVLNYGGSLKDLRGSKIYVTLFPCDSCAKILAQAGIKEVIYLNDFHHDDPIYEASRLILDGCGIKYTKFERDTNVVVNIDISESK